ncbi:MAG: 4-hydroxy-3-methylbut-2-enyl diphosphate reductase [Dehalococcoidia bacterium]
MHLYLAVPRGFCAGVVRAIDIVHKSLQLFGSPVYVKHQIVHNKYVVADLEKKGAITVENIEDVPKDSTVIFSAHGSPPKDYELAKSKNIKIIDATCPLVTKVHNEAIKYSKQGRKIILIGHRGHQEVVGTMGQVDMILIDDREKNNVPEFDTQEPVAVLSQTTLSIDDTKEISKTLKQKYKNSIIRNDICYAVTNRQNAVKKLATLVDIIIVVGSDTSSNCVRLKEMSESCGTKSILVNSVEEIKTMNLTKYSKIGITSGASTPEVLIDEFINFLKPSEINTVGDNEKDINFVLPNEVSK